MSPHTPGPWRVEPRADHDILGGGFWVARVIAKTYPGMPEDERVANAALIAASPTMLALLRRALDRVDEAALHAEIDRTIAAAEGRS